MASKGKGTVLAAKTNEIVSYKPISFKAVKEFRDKVLAGKEAPVELFIVEKPCDDGRGFGVSKGDTLLKVGGKGKTGKFSRPWGDTKTGKLPLQNLKLKPRVEWTCEDVCEYAVKPLCMNVQSYYTDVLAKEDHTFVRKKDFDRGTFVSYARKMVFDELVKALDNYFTNEPTVDPDQVFIWMDIFCANQPKLTDPFSAKELMSIRYDLLTKGLHHAIATFERKVIVFDDWKNPAPLKRAWCVWEVFGVALAGQELNIAMPPQQEDAFIAAFKAQQDFGDILNSLAAIDVQSAKCFNEDDLKMIHGAIERDSSFTAVNEKVLSKLREWHVRVVKTELKKVQGSNSDTEILLLSSLSKLLWRQGELAESVERAKQALEVAKALYGAEHASVAGGLNNVAQLLSQQGKFSEAEPLLVEASKISEKTYGKDHPDHSRILSSLGYLYQAQGKLDEARPLFEETLRIMRVAFGSNHPRVSIAINNLATLLQAQGKFDEAEPLLRESLELDKATMGPEHPDYALTLNNLAQVLTEKGKTKEALSMLEEAIKVVEKVFSQSHPLFANCVRNKGRCLSKMGQFEQANVCFRQALEISLQLSGEMNIAVAKIRWWFADSLKAEGAAKESKAQWKKANTIYETIGLTTHPDYKKCQALWQN